jgi:uncharacterized protein (TIGR00297 family)
MEQLISGLILGVAISLLAWRAGALSASGAWAAAISGGLIFGLGGLPWAILLLAFFISSSALSRLFGGRKADLSEKFSKGGRRDWGQVLANGGLGAILVTVYTARPETAAFWDAVLWCAYAGAIATVNADTWATELGVLSRTPPRLITSGEVVERGASGGVSALGSLASLGGALLVAVLATLFAGRAGAAPWPVLPAAALGGLAGAFFDSLLGASVQAIYYCPGCDKETERHPQHSCGAPTFHLRGWRWLDNDLVNFIASVVGALVAVGIWAVIEKFI